MGAPRSQRAAQPRELGLDPLAVLSGLDLPFAFLGFAPALFDAPIRQDRSVAYVKPGELWPEVAADESRLIPRSLRESKDS